MGRHTVLIVEDQVLEAQDLAHSLETLGYEIAGVVGSGEEALKWARERRPDVILMDVKLKGKLDGIGAAQAIRNQLNIPVVYLTAYTDDEQIDLAVLTEPYAYLVKPCDEDELNATLRMALYKHRIESQLRESEQRYRMILEDVPAMVNRYLPDGTITFANETYAHYQGMTQDQLVGKNLFDLIPEADRMRLKLELKGLTTDQSVCVYEHDYRNAEGSIQSIRWIDRALFGENRELLEFQAVGIDLTDRKNWERQIREAHDELEQRVEERTADLLIANKALQSEIVIRRQTERQLAESEQRCRSIIETAMDAIFIQDEQSRLTLVNPAMEDLFRRPASQLLGKTHGDLFEPELAGQLNEIDSRVLTGETIERQQTFMIESSPVTLLTNRSPLRDADGKIVGLCGIARNITDRLKTPVTHPASDEEYRSAAMRSTVQQLRIAASADSIVLLLGESGVGKDFMARFIHSESSRSGGPLFTLNCATLPPELADSELFGHEAGAFTGARTRNRGLLELAEGGTLLLNEIGELSLPLQAKLLSFLDSREFTRVGGRRPIAVNARILAATNRDLQAEVANGRFRSDLFYRLQVMSITIPPLRERREDLPQLVERILEELTSDMVRSNIPEVDPKDLKVLQTYSWPGNVRELRNLIERAVIMSTDQTLDLAAHLREQGSQDWCLNIPFPDETSLNDLVKDVKRSLVIEALRRSQGNRQEAAQLLGISRYALKRQMTNLDLMGL